MLWDENVQIWRSSPSGHLTGHKRCCLVSIWVIWHTSAGLGTTSSCLMRFFLEFYWFGWFGWFCNFCRFCRFFWMFVASKFSTISVAVFVAPHWVPISCSLQTRLQPLPVQTQGTQLLKLFIQVYYINSHQHYEMSQLRYHTVQCSKITVVANHIMVK